MKYGVEVISGENVQMFVKPDRMADTQFIKHFTYTEKGLLFLFEDIELCRNKSQTEEKVTISIIEEADEILEYLKFMMSG